MGAPGCDDAPVVKVEQRVGFKPVTVIYPYYENPHFLEKQIEGWISLPFDLRVNLLNFIIVDDGSPSSQASKVVVRSLANSLLRIRVFRIGVDVRWNWLAARNIGWYHAPDGWCVCTDIDHVIPPVVFDTLAYGRHDPGIIYRFSRRERDGKKIHPHPNSWFMMRQMYWKVGGYDERMSGYYGSDGYYRRRCAASAPIRIMSDELERWEHFGDSSTQRYLRKQPEDARLRPLVRSFPPNSRPKILSFPYQEVAL